MSVATERGVAFQANGTQRTAYPTGLRALEEASKVMYKSFSAPTVLDT